jgi:hypothetical protein
MARPQVSDKGDGHQIWRVAANILNTQSRKADRGRSSSLGAWVGELTIPTIKTKLCYVTLHAAPTWTDSLARPKHRKMDKERPGRPRRRWEDDMDLGDIDWGWGGVVVRSGFKWLRTGDSGGML